MAERFVWVFCGEGARLPSAAFESRAAAECWIAEHALSGLLTAYPLDEGVYEWSIRKGYFSSERSDQRTPKFIQMFSSASLEHFHYVDGIRRP